MARRRCDACGGATAARDLAPVGPYVAGATDPLPCDWPHACAACRAIWRRVAGALNDRGASVDAAAVRHFVADPAVALAAATSPRPVPADVDGRTARIDADRRAAIAAANLRGPPLKPWPRSSDDRAARASARWRFERSVSAERAALRRAARRDAAEADRSARRDAAEADRPAPPSPAPPPSRPAILLRRVHVDYGDHATI